jgi:hypothetical protein
MWRRRLIVAGQVSRGIAAARRFGDGRRLRTHLRNVQGLAPSRLLRFTLTLPEANCPDDQR